MSICQQAIRRRRQACNTRKRYLRQTKAKKTKAPIMAGFGKVAKTAQK